MCFSWINCDAELSPIGSWATCGSIACKAMFVNLVHFAIGICPWVLKLELNTQKGPLPLEDLGEQLQVLVPPC